MILFYGFHKRLNRTGRYALVAVLIGTVLALVSLIWDYYLFPHPHSVWGVGWGIFLIGVFPLTTFGWLIFGLSSLRLAIFPYWVKTLFFVMFGSLILTFIYDPRPNHSWSELLQFILRAEIETIVGQLALVGLGVYPLFHMLSREDLHLIETT